MLMQNPEFPFLFPSPWTAIAAQALGMPLFLKFFKILLKNFAPVCRWIQPCDTPRLFLDSSDPRARPRFSSRFLVVGRSSRFSGHLVVETLIPLHQPSPAREILVQLLGLRADFRVSRRFPAAGSLGRNSRSSDRPRLFHE